MSASLREKTEWRDAVARAREIQIKDVLDRRGHQLRRKRRALVGPCPKCGGDDRFVVTPAKRLWFCRNCGRGGSIIDLIMHLDGCDLIEAVTKLTNWKPSAREGAEKSAREPQASNRDRDQEYQAFQLQLAEHIWRAAKPLTPEVLGYFACRGIDINRVPDHGGLRFHRRCLFDDALVPCIVGRYTDAVTGEPRGIWRRPLDGRKPKTLGPMAGCVIRLWDDAEITTGLVLGEGVETTFAAATRITHRGTLLQPAWAASVSRKHAEFPSAGRRGITDVIGRSRHERYGSESGR